MPASDDACHATMARVCAVARYPSIDNGGMRDLRYKHVEDGQDGPDDGDTRTAVRNIALSRSIAGAAEEEETLDGLLYKDLDFNVDLDAVDYSALDPLLLLGSDPHNRVRVGLGRVTPRPGYNAKVRTSNKHAKAVYSLAVGRALPTLSFGLESSCLALKSATSVSKRPSSKGLTRKRSF